MTKTLQPPPEANRNPKDSSPTPPPRDTTKGHRDDEKNNIEEQGERANIRQNTSNRRPG